MSELRPCSCQRRLLSLARDSRPSVRTGACVRPLLILPPKSAPRRHESGGGDPWGLRKRVYVLWWLQHVPNHIKPASQSRDWGTLPSPVDVRGKPPGAQGRGPCTACRRAREPDRGKASAVCEISLPARDNGRPTKLGPPSPVCFICESKRRREAFLPQTCGLWMSSKIFQCSRFEKRARFSSEGLGGLARGRRASPGHVNSF